jgi:hypothetical protein
MTHPSGAVGEFVFQPTQHGRARVFPRCAWDARRQEDANRSAGTASYAIALVRKTLSGPALPTRTWRMAYGGQFGSWAECTTCNTIRTTEVTDNAGHFARYVFSMQFGVSEGRLLEQHDGRDGRVLRKSWHYFDSPELSPRPQFARTVGRVGDFWGKDPTDEMQLPRRGGDVLQDGVTFRWWVVDGCGGTLCFDAFARPLAVRRTDSLGASKLEATWLHDDKLHWTLGQVARTTTDGIETRRTQFDATTALPVRTHVFGALAHAWTYHANGRVATVADGNGHVTHYARWERGIPQRIHHPATPDAPFGTVENHEVGRTGLVEHVTDADGQRTCFEHDAMGRVAKITYPSEKLAGECDESTWAPTTIRHSHGHAAAYGVPAGHWRRTTSIGTGRHMVLLDALWRPVVEQWMDFADPEGTRTEVFLRYDASGRLAFRSHPLQADAHVVFTHAALKGTHTSYDGLGRVVRVEEDSELGKLVTKTEYLVNGQVRVTDPRGHATTTTYRFFDGADGALPVRIQQPEGVRTDIVRDVFGKPTSVTRSGPRG